MKVSSLTILSFFCCFQKEPEDCYSEAGPDQGKEIDLDRGTGPDQEKETDLDQEAGPDQEEEDRDPEAGLDQNLDQ